MVKANLEFPFYDPDPRRVLDSFSKEVKEEPIREVMDKGGKIETSPSMLALSIMLAAQNHLNLLVNTAPKISLQVNKEQKEKLYLELLTLYYFLVGQQLGKYLHGDQFTLFVVKLHVELLDNLPKTRDTWWLFGMNPFIRSKKIKKIVGEDCWKTGLSDYIDKGEKFYIKNKLDDEEIKGIDNLKPLLLGEHKKDYGKNLMLQFLIKIFYRLTKILNLSTSENLVAIIALYSANSTPILESQKQVFGKIKPIWHQKLPAEQNNPGEKN